AVGQKRRDQLVEARAIGPDAVAEHDAWLVRCVHFGCSFRWKSDARHQAGASDEQTTTSRTSARQGCLFIHGWFRHGQSFMVGQAPGSFGLNERYPPFCTMRPTR